MSDRLGLCMNLKRVAVSQFANYNFNSMCKVGNVYLGANENGIFELDSGSTDNTTDITAAFELLTTDFGIEQQKRIRSVFLGYETDGRLILKIKDDDNNERDFTLPAEVGGNKQVSAKVNPGRDGKGRYWMIRVENVEGSDFSIDTITAILTLLTRKP
jgi:hypothetical protein